MLNLFKRSRCALKYGVCCSSPVEELADRLVAAAPYTHGARLSQADHPALPVTIRDTVQCALACVAGYNAGGVPELVSAIAGG